MEINRSTKTHTFLNPQNTRSWSNLIMISTSKTPPSVTIIIVRRPIVRARLSMTRHISEIFDFYIKIFVQNRLTYVKDTTYYIRVNLSYPEVLKRITSEAMTLKCLALDLAKSSQVVTNSFNV